MFIVNSCIFAKLLVGPQCTVCVSGVDVWKIRCQSYCVEAMGTVKRSPGRTSHSARRCGATAFSENLFVSLSLPSCVMVGSHHYVHTHMRRHMRRAYGCVSRANGYVHVIIYRVESHVHASHVHAISSRQLVSAARAAV